MNSTWDGAESRLGPDIAIESRWARIFLLTTAVVLASCGGGGGSDSTPDPVSDVATPSSMAPSSSVAALCAAPRTGSSDRQGTLADEKRWVQSWIDETYLWYGDVRGLGAATLDPRGYAGPIAYFDALKSPVITASGDPRDKFHFVHDTAEWQALSHAGQSIGYGFEIALSNATPPRKVTIAYTNPDTPAAAAGLSRGAQVLTVDGVDMVNDGTVAGVATLNNGLFPTAPGFHTFTILEPGAAAPRAVVLTAAPVTATPVQNVKTLPAPHQSVGYLQFNDHIATSEQQLITAISQLKAAGVSDLVLDVRYNGGGYLDIASELAYMIAGPAVTSGKTFELQVFNDKNPFHFTAAERTVPFHQTSQGFSTATGQPLPYLGLNRVYVLAGGNTCSASESIINGLRGVGVRVETFGGTTCGKPYGFYPTDNCGTTYFAIQFQGVNQQGFGDYADGLAPTCAAADDFAHALGDPSEGQLKVALNYRSTGACLPGMAKGLGARAEGTRAESMLVRSPLRENRMLRTP